MDFLYKLMVDNEVVVLKTNPVNAWVGPSSREGVRSVDRPGFLAIVYGGAAVGAHLANHPKVDTLHVTGSDKTYDAIVWGADPVQRDRRKAEDQPINRRPFTAELGCVTPVLVVPGPWSAADMRFQARQVAGMVAQNASFNCNAAKVLVVARGWLQRDTFLKYVDEELAKTPPRKAYYPGAEDRYKGFLGSYPKARALGAAGADVVPWTVIPDVPAQHGEYALTNEAFCGVLAEVTLDATTPVEFLEKAVAFANDDCWGTLSCNVLVHPATEESHPAEVDPRHREPSLRRHRHQLLGRDRLRPRVHHLGSVPGAHTSRHPVGRWRGAQRAAVRPSREVGRAGPVPHLAHAGLVRRPQEPREPRPRAREDGGRALVGSARQSRDAGAEGVDGFYAAEHLQLPADRLRSS